MTTSKNDSDLREMLAKSKTYVDANEKSVEIILDKYQLKLLDIESQITDSERAFSAISQALLRLNKLYNFLCEAALGHIEIREEKLAQKYDGFESALKELISWFEESKGKLRTPVEISTVLYDWILNIDRLSKGRWKRFGVDSQHSIAVKKVQIEMQKKANQLSSYYDLLAVQVKAMGKAGPEDLRIELVESIKKSGFVRAANDMLEVLQKIDSIMDSNIATKSLS